MFATTRLRLVGALGISAALAALVALVAFSSDAQADHSWGNYHWRINSNQFTNQFTLLLGDNVSGPWDDHLITTSGDSDWSKSDVLDTTVVAGKTRPKTCKATSGRVEVCNATYGNNGWLGLAQIWLSGNHITQGVTKMNDTYFNRDRYDTPAWRLMVICQEVGHTFGLDHTNEKFDDPNLGSCMDYTNDPDGPPSNEHPGGDDPTTPAPDIETDHDYVQLETIYDHYHTTTTVGSATAASTMPPAASRGSFNSKAEWGRKIRESRDGHLELWERSFGNGFKLLTWVIRP
jgi:hypothetical protein